MKRYRLLIWPIWLLLGMMFLAACQSDALPEEEKGGGKQVVSYGDSSYINLRIVGNSQAITRATFSDLATAGENAVYDGILCIFEGTDEASATLKTAVYIDQLINNPGSEASSQELNVTQHLSIGKLPIGTGLHRYVLALLNTTSTGFKVSGGDLLFDGSSQTGMTISQIQILQIHSVGSVNKHVGLFMSNAPQNGYIMPEVTSSYLYDTEATAAAGSRLTINVERAAARVKVTNSATMVSVIDLDDNESRHPTVHRMTWTLHNYNTQSYAIRKDFTAEQNWATSITGENIPIVFDTTVPDIFDLYKQHSYKDGDDVYIAENTTDTDANQTRVIVEVQLKEGSFLLGDCYRYQLWGIDIFFTSADKFIQYCKEKWTSDFAKMNPGLSAKSADEIFKYPSLVINANGKVTVTLINDSFTSDEKGALAGLSVTLSNTLTGYRDGKMYYTYKIKHDTDHEFGVVRNNAYNLTLQNSSITEIGRPTP